MVISQSFQTTQTRCVLKPVDEELNITYPFDNDNYTMVLGAHGISYLEEGMAFVFPDSWEHFIRIEIPKQSQIKSEIDWMKCREMLDRVRNMTNTTTSEDQPLIETPPGQPKPVRYNRVNANICERLKHFYDKSIEKAKLILDNAYDQFHSRIRNKRSLWLLLAAPAAADAAAGAVTGGVTAYFVTKHMIGPLKEKIHEMEGKVENLEHQTAVIAENLIGLTQTITEMQQDFQK